jgi:DNA-binding transcriptional MerR regulator
MGEDICEYLPPIIPFKNYNNDWDTFLEDLYKIYLNDFYNIVVKYKNLPVKTFTALDYNGKQQTFNHITTKGSNHRLYNQLRCERIRWIKALIENDNCRKCNHFASWPEKEKNKIRILIWCRKVDFLVVLEQRKDYYNLITAYKVIYDKKRNELIKKYIKSRNRLSQG